jgi:hypothetical protein
MSATLFFVGLMVLIFIACTIIGLAFGDIFVNFILLIASILILLVSVVLVISFGAIDYNKYCTIVDKKVDNDKYIVYYKHNTFLIYEKEVSPKVYSNSKIGVRTFYPYLY